LKQPIGYSISPSGSNKADISPANLRDVNYFTFFNLVIRRVWIKTLLLVTITMQVMRLRTKR
jgi:hypothetical protein